jgi:hypothetical protein
MYEAFHNAPWEWAFPSTNDPRLTFVIGIFITLAIKCGALGLLLKILKALLPSTVFFPIFLGVTIIKIAAKKFSSAALSAIGSVCRRKTVAPSEDQAPVTKMRKPRMRDVPTSQYIEPSSFAELAEEKLTDKAELTSNQLTFKESSEDGIQTSAGDEVD